MAALLAEFRSKFDLLAQSLPSRFLPNLNRVYEKLPSVFSGALPFVLSHGDLCEMNLLISPETGHISGIVDWAEARILPFGFSLWGFENILGFMDSKGWHYYDNRDELEDLFWRTFWTEAPDASKADLELIQTARMAGLFCRYGLVVEGKDLKDLLGLQVLGKDIPEMRCEFVLEGNGTVMLDARDVKDWIPYRSTGFALKVPGITELQGNETHAKTNRDTHEVFIGGKIGKEDPLMDVLHKEGIIY
ncbi:kinase-like domain-containing protein [Fusarium circinatum]|uniref:Kinase-like domain-containing protein n=1 Tax=Fusarium circinatum TaxID=48490 RepID=A0A8H5U7Y2_FUSCI|nr:kinase-like domain-containing protein [Fusarium circinatum]